MVRKTEVPFSFFVQEHSKNQGDHNTGDNLDKGVFDRIQQRLPSIAGGKDLLVIFKPDEFSAASEGVGFKE